MFEDLVKHADMRVCLLSSPVSVSFIILFTRGLKIMIHVPTFGKAWDLFISSPKKIYLRGKERVAK